MVQIYNLNNNIYKQLDIIYIMPFQKGNTFGSINKGRKDSLQTIELKRKRLLDRYESGEEIGFRKGHKINVGGNKTSWKVGHNPWNKDLKGFMLGETNPNWKGGLPKCECGKILSTRISKYCNNCKGEIISNKLKGRKGHPKMGGYIFPIGNKHPNWKGGTSTEYEKRCSLSSWKKIRKEILNRDNHTCRRCNNNEQLVVDHIIPWRITKDNS